MPRRYARYRPAARYRPPFRYRVLRSIQLTAVGRTMLGSACLVGATAGHVLGGVAGAVLGAAAAPVALVCVDRLRWRPMWTGYSTDQDLDRIVAELRRAGVDVRVRRGDHGLHVRNRDRRRVARVLIGLGIRPPRYW